MSIFYHCAMGDQPAFRIRMASRRWLDAGDPSEKLNHYVGSGCFVRHNIVAPTGNLFVAVPDRIALGYLSDLNRTWPALRR